MSKNTVSLTGALMTVATDMNLKAGMRVVVVNGVVLSIYSGDTAVPLSTVQERITKSHIPTIPLEAKSKRRHSVNKSYMKMDGSPLNTIVPHIDTLRSMVAKFGEVSIKDFRAAMSTDGGTKGNWKVNSAVAYLVGTKEIVMSGTPHKRIINKGENFRA